MVVFMDESSKIDVHEICRAWSVLRAMRAQRNKARLSLRLRFFGTGGILFNERVAHPVVADFGTSPMTSDQAGETFRALRHECAEVVAHRFLDFLASLSACGASLLGDDHQAAHVRQAAGDGLNGKDCGVSAFQPIVPAVFCVAGRRGEPAAAIRWASTNAVGWLPLS